MITYVPFQDMSDEQWAAMYAASYSPELIETMGGDIPQEVLPLQDFYNKAMTEIEAGQLVGWAIVDDEAYLGHTLLVHTQGEWEVGVAVVSESNRGRGLGVRAGLHAFRYAFEELGAQHLIAFVLGKDGVVKDYVERMGFRPMFHFMYLPREVWESRWQNRGES